MRDVSQTVRPATVGVPRLPALLTHHKHFMKKNLNLYVSVARTRV